MAFALSRHFDLSYTYFLIAGIAGVNPFYATTGSVTFARYAVQVALQYEIDIRELPSNYSTGYIPQHSTVPETYPETVYGTEVFEVNAALRDRAIALAKKATLNDTVEAAAYREKYNYSPANQPPAVVACDTATSDVYFPATCFPRALETTHPSSPMGQACIAAVSKKIMQPSSHCCGPTLLVW